MNTARNIHRDRMRQKRKLLFPEVNAAWMRAEMLGLDKAGIAEKYQQLLDVPAAPEIEQAQTPEELKDLWPTEILGEQPVQEIPPPPPPPRDPYGWDSDGNPLWTKREFNAYTEQFEAALRQAKDAPLPVASDEPEPVAIEDQQYPQEPEQAVPEPPLDLPRMFREADESPMAAAMRRVERPRNSTHRCRNTSSRAIKWKRFSARAMSSGYARQPIRQPPTCKPCAGAMTSPCAR